MATDVALETSMARPHPPTLPQYPSPPPTNTEDPKKQGTILVELYPQHAPRTCQNFATLASRGYYDGTVFHRIIPDFMVQGGDPTGTGRGGASIYGEKFEDEITGDLKRTSLPFVPSLPTSDLLLSGWADVK